MQPEQEVAPSTQVAQGLRQLTHCPFTDTVVEVHWLQYVELRQVRQLVGHCWQIPVTGSATELPRHLTQLPRTSWN